MGMALACQVLGTQMRISHMHTLYRVCCMTFAKYKRCQGLCTTVEPESWVKLLVKIRERVEIIYIIIVFVSVLIGFVIAVILAHVTWALAQEWALSILAAKTVTWVFTQEWALAWDTTVYPGFYLQDSKFREEAAIDNAYVVDGSRRELHVLCKKAF